MNRRNFLISSSSLLALPLFGAAAENTKKFKRLVCMSNPFGMIPDAFYPENEGFIKTMPKTLSSLSEFKNKITIFKNLDHGLSGGHSAAEAIFSGVIRKESKNRPEGNISIDQKYASHFGHLTRLPYINIQLGRGYGFGDISYYTKEGICVPALRSPETLFDLLFTQADKSITQKMKENYNKDLSILDTVLADIRSTSKGLSPKDRSKLEEYTDSVREVEKTINYEKHWLNEAKPKTAYKIPKKQNDFTSQSKSLIDLIGLAFETDSTRIATIGVSGRSSGTGTGLEYAYHGASHHGNEKVNIDQLKNFEKVQMDLLARLVKKLDSTPDNVNGGTILDHTLVLFASGISNPSAHDNRNLPVMTIGGGLKHKGLTICPEVNKTPLSNLLLSSLHYLGVEVEQFGRSKGTFNHLRLV